MMNGSLRIACSLIFAASAAAMSGCVVTAESLVRYEGTEQTRKVEYLPTQGVRIVSDNGNVEVSTGDVSEVVVTFAPFTMRRDGEDDLAEAEIENDLELAAIIDGDVVISAGRRAGKTSGYLGTDIEVVLPADFDGVLRVEQDNGGVEVDLDGAPSRGTTIESNNGSIDVVGARGAIDVATGNGSVFVDLDAWSSSDGSISSGNGEIELAVPAEVDGTMTALTELGVVVDQGIPATWATAGEGGAKSYTMGDGDGGQLDLFTELGDITITVK